MKKLSFSLSIIGCLALSLHPAVINAKNSKSAMSVDNQQINAWNQFADRLYILHQHQIAQNAISQSESTGGYMGNGEFYREVKFTDKKSGRLLSRVLWEIENPDQIHEIEVFVYDDNGRLKRDYLAAFLPEHRNAPVQTLINLHYQNDEVKSFRQFDASGDKIYERCEGKFFGAPVSISLTDDDFYSGSSDVIKTMESEEYLSCFQNVLPTLGDYADPLFDIQLSADLLKHAEITEHATPDSVEQKIRDLTKALKNNKSAKNYYERGDAYFKLNKFDEAVNDFNQAIKLDDSMDAAYFGRGLAYGRLRVFDKSIADLTVFIERNPNSSVAYTKRGVRRIWAEQYKLAEEDLKIAIKLDPKNAEAYDDLGVMDARNGKYKEALEHFKKVVDLDPSYSKGFHNLAMTHYILGNYNEALLNVNKSLALLPNDKNALLLKGETLNKLGMQAEAKAVLERAEFIPDAGGWQERFSLQ